MNIQEWASTCLVTIEKPRGKPHIVTLSDQHHSVSIPWPELYHLMMKAIQR